MNKIWLSLFLIASLFLFVFSFTQVDLNLTLSSNTLYQTIQNYLTKIGYFNRPVASIWFVSVISIMCVSYYGLIYQTINNHIAFSNIIKLVLITSFLLTLAYPAFSHDVFNYIFDARIAIHHQQNPYQFTALDFPDDTWTRFMRWTHRTFPYGPVWLLISLPTYVLGLGKFTLTLLAFKLLSLNSYLISVWAIFKLTTRLQPKYTKLAVVLFALNPLILIESLLSSHLDITMLALSLLGLYLAFASNRLAGIVATILGGLTKFTTLGLSLILILIKPTKSSFQKIVYLSLITTILLTAYVILNRELLPWYAIVPFGFGFLLPNRLLRNLFLITTPALLFRYTPFLFHGVYSPKIHSQEHLISLAIFIIGGIVLAAINRTNHHVTNKKNSPPTSSLLSL